MRLPGAYGSGMESWMGVLAGDVPFVTAPEEPAPAAMFEVCMVGLLLVEVHPFFFLFFFR